MSTAYDRAREELEACRQEIAQMVADLEARCGFVLETEADFEAALARAPEDWARDFHRAMYRETLLVGLAVRAFVDNDVTGAPEEMKS